MHCRLMLVDDDANVLAALRRELLRPPVIGTDGLEIESFRLPEEALARAGQPDAMFDAIVVDYHMPQMNGIDLLDRLRQAQPDAIRILLTGEIGMEGALAAINTSRVDHLLTKPWHEYDLKSRIALAIHERQLVRDTDHTVTTPHDPASKVGVGETAATPGRVLIVDDEVAVVHALQREFLAIARDHRYDGPPLEIITATSAAAAREACAVACPQIVLADYQMPETDGISLLHALRTACPGSVRVLMSGRADTRVLLDAINIAGVHHFLAKPWQTTELRALLAEARSYAARLNSDSPPPPNGITDS